MATNPRSVIERGRLERALRAAAQQGDTASAQRIARQLRPLLSEPTPPTREQLLQQAGQRAGTEAGGLQGALVNIGTGIPGGRALASRLISLTQDVTPDEARTFLDAATQEVRSRDPLAADVGALTGGIVAGGAAGAGVQAGLRGLSAARAAPAVLRRGAQALRFQPGQLGRNVLRAAPEGAALGSAAAALEGEDVSEGAVEGAVGAPVGTVLGSAVGAGLRTGGRLLGTQSGAGRIARSLISVSPQELRRRAAEFFDLRGRGPRISEIVAPDEGGRSLGAVGTLRPRAGEVLEESADAARRSRQAETQAALGRGRVQTPSPQSLSETRAASINRQFEDIAEDPITLTRDVREFLDDPEFINSLPRNAPLPDGSGTAASLRRKILEATQGEATLTVRDIENIRQLTSVPRFAQEARSVLRSQSPGADAALTEFGRRGDVIQGREGNLLRTGRLTRQGAREMSLDDLVQQARTGTESQRRQAIATLVGARAQGREELIRRAGESPQQAERVLNELTASENLRRNVNTLFGPNAARRLLRQGEVGDIAARGIESTRPTAASTSGVIDAQSPSLQAAALLTNRFGAGFISNFARNLQVSLRVPPAASRRLAELVSDPARTDEAVELLRRLRINDENLADVLAATSAGFAVDESTGTGAASGTIGLGAGLGVAAGRRVGGLLTDGDQ